MNKIKILALIIIAVSFAVGVYFYPQLPEKVASHWNASGAVDGYMNKFWGLFLMPILALAVFLLFIFLPKIDPLKENIKKFKGYFDGFILALIIFFFYIYILTIVWNKGIYFDMGRFLIPALGILFFYAGVLIEKSKRNWFMGIKTPWTLSSDQVWDKTNKLGGKLFKISGVIAFLGIFMPSFAMILVLVPIILTAIYLFVYSYVEYKKENKSKK
jgi:uncharacterized membrane protein